jgi:hypothetical protein
MQHKKGEQNWNTIREQAKLEYDTIGIVYSPALKSDIVFNADGFHHLRYDGSRKERSKSAQTNKFRFFQDGVGVLKKSTTVQEYRRSICPVGKKDKSGFRKTKTVEWFGFFAIISFSKQIRVKVIVRRLGGESGSYHFWSVMPFWTVTNNHRHVGSKDLVDQ